MVMSLHCTWMRCWASTASRFYRDWVGIGLDVLSAAKVSSTDGGDDAYILLDLRVQKEEGKYVQQ
ncbi:hypothetical protein ACP70R_009341 [Stipagrostis hirtigluma subsp. patula]